MWITRADIDRAVALLSDRGYEDVRNLQITEDGIFFCAYLPVDIVAELLWKLFDEHERRLLKPIIGSGFLEYVIFSNGEEAITYEGKFLIDIKGPILNKVRNVLARKVCTDKKDILESLG